MRLRVYAAIYAAEISVCLRRCICMYAQLCMQRSRRLQLPPRKFPAACAAVRSVSHHLLVLVLTQDGGVRTGPRNGQAAVLSVRALDDAVVDAVDAICAGLAPGCD